MSIRTSALAALLVLVPVTAMAQTSAGCGGPADLQDGWPVASPDETGLDPGSICTIGPRLEALKLNVHAVVVARHGVLVYERYFAGEDEMFGRPLGRVAYDAGTRHDLRSVTKSVTSLLVGIAADIGAIKDLDAPVFSFFPEYASLRTPEKDRITLRHLLTMSAGLAWNETGVSYKSSANSETQMDAAADPYRYVLEQPVEQPAGELYNYSSGSTALIGAVLRKATGRPVERFAKEYLFDPLGIRDVEWVRNANGEARAEGGLRLRPRDVAKIGQLVLEHGGRHGRQIVPAAWVDQSTAPQIPGEGLFFYGYQWWLGRSLVDRREVDWVAGIGSGGQRLFIVPSLDMVVVVMAGLYDNPLQGVISLGVLNRGVLPAAVGR